MNNFNDAFVLLKRNCEASPSFMLVKALGASPAALDAVMMFDEVADYPKDVMDDKNARNEIVTELLTKAVSASAESIRAAQSDRVTNSGASS